MKTRAIVLTLLIGVMLSGCSLFRESLVEISKEDVRNAEAVREAAINFAITWEPNSGYIHGSLGSRITEFPLQFIMAMNELDTLFIGDRDEDGKFVASMTKEEKREKIESMSEYELFYGLGLRVRTLEALVQDALKQFAPDVLNYLPFPLKF